MKLGIKITKSSLPLITALNSGVEPLLEATSNDWYLIEIEDDGTLGHADIVTKREMLKTHDIKKRTPFVLSLKEI